MNLDKVFIGFTKDGKEHLFYKKIRFYEYDRIMTIFYDLENNEEYSYCDIDVVTLKPFCSEFDINKKSYFKKKVINMYKGNRESAIFKNENSLIPITKRKILEMDYKRNK